MNNIYEWARRHNVQYHAVQELLGMFGLVDLPHVKPKAGMTEDSVQQRCRLRVQELGGRAMRNNVGVYFDDRGVPVRYGLCNESKKINQQLKSSDLICIIPRVITPDMIGHTIGQFGAIEVKHGGWQYSGSKHEEAQLNFINLITSLGGYATFANDPKVIK